MKRSGKMQSTGRPEGLAHHDLVSHIAFICYAPRTLSIPLCNSLHVSLPVERVVRSGSLCGS